MLIERGRLVWRLAIGLVLIVACAAASHAEAATIRLKNGNTLYGTITSMDDEQIEIDIPGLGKLTFARAEVAAIEESAEPVAQASAARSENETEEGGGGVISEMSYRNVGLAGDQKESGISIQQFPGRIVIRDYRIPVNEEVRAQHPTLFFDRTARLTKEEHEELWLQLLEAVDVWNLESEPAPNNPTVVRCEATFKRGDQFVHYVSYAVGAPCWGKTPYNRLTQVISNGVQAFGSREAEKRDGKSFGTYAFVRRRQPGSSR